MANVKTFKSSVNIKSGQSANAPMKLVSTSDLKAGEKALFSTVYGIADGVVKRADPTGDTAKDSYGLSGNFEILSAIDGQTIGGATLFAPDGIHTMIAAQLNKGARTVSFAFEAYVVAGGTAGFTWEYRFIDNGAPEEEDILAGVRALIPSLKSQLVAFPTKAEVAKAHK
jgi:hypothetical protein